VAVFEFLAAATGAGIISTYGVQAHRIGRRFA
jgi:hypothetical protein